MNQNLLIIDDEIEILIWLEEMFRFSFDMEIGVYTANSAIDALEILNTTRIDVVLTDICMPGMNGITLFEKVRENWPRCKVVFLTGYRNFEDIYHVINSEGVQYILKSEEHSVILDAVRQFLQKEQEELIMEQQIQQVEKANALLQQELLKQMIIGNLSETEIMEKADILGFNIDFRRKMLVFLNRIDRKLGDDFSDKRFLQEEYLVQALTEDIPEKLQFFVYVMENQMEVLFVQPTDENNDNWEQTVVLAKGMVEYAQERFFNTCQETFSTITSSQPVFAGDIAKHIRRMKQGMIRYLGGAEGIIADIDYMNEEATEGSDNNIAVKIPMLRSYLELHKREEYFELLGRCFQDMINKDSLHDTLALEVYYNISILLLQFINENRLNEQVAFKIGIYKLTRADVHENWGEAAEYLREISEVIFLLADQDVDVLSDKAIKRVVTYIDEHLDEELSLTTLAKRGGFNASYLSRLFKQLTNKNLSDYITDKRMELACNLLANTNDRIQDIAIRSGYISPNSFTRAFRNEKGISPKEYREIHMK